MIYAYELILLNALKGFWEDLYDKLDTPDDYIPYIFPYLPATGDFGANQQSIRELVRRLHSGSTADDLTVILEFPVRTNIPCIFIETGNEQEDEVVGGVVAEQYDSDAQQWYSDTGGPFVKMYRVGVYTWNADTTLYLYSIVKYGLLLLRSNLADAANFNIAGEKMVQDYQRFHPDTAYIRTFNIIVEGVLDTVTERANRITDVTVTATTTEDEGNG